MDWSEIVIKVPVKDMEKASAIAQMAAGSGIYIEDYSNIEAELKEFGFVELIDSELLSKDKSNSIIHIYISPEDDINETEKFVKKRLEASDIPYEMHIGHIKDEDWMNNWKKYFKPIEVGEKLVIKPSWENYTNEGGRLVLEIDPGMAFGSGTHESTRLCMANIEKYIFPGAKVLDIGCGSGILSIASLLLDARHVTALDIDPLAVKVTKENMILNSIGVEKYTVMQGDLLSSAQLRGSIGKYDMILVNIVADIIIALTPIMKNLLNAGGKIICSGIVKEREEDVIKSFDANGYKILSMAQENGWVSFVCGL